MSRYKKALLAANAIIAACAVAALGFAVYQNVQMAEVLESARDAFSTQAFPVVKFMRNDWIVAERPWPSCENPAHGINVAVQNMSGVPVITKKLHLALRMGDRQILDQPSERTIGTDSKILAPGEPTSMAIAEDVFKGHFARLKGPDAGPLLNFDVGVTYASLTTGRCYQYEGTVTVLYDCRYPTDHRGQTVSEKPIVQIPCRE
jgi:hypothetical protein